MSPSGPSASSGGIVTPVMLTPVILRSVPSFEREYSASEAVPMRNVPSLSSDTSSSVMSPIGCSLPTGPAFTPTSTICEPAPEMLSQVMLLPCSTSRAFSRSATASASCAADGAAESIRMAAAAVSSPVVARVVVIACSLVSPFPEGMD